MTQWNNSGKKDKKRKAKTNRPGQTKCQLVVRDHDESHHEPHDDVSTGSFSDNNEQFSDSERSLMNQIIDRTDNEDSDNEMLEQEETGTPDTNNDNVSIHGDLSHTDATP